MKQVSKMQALVGREENASWQTGMFLAFQKEPVSVIQINSSHW